MKSALAVALMAASLSLCNLTEKFTGKNENSSASSMEKDSNSSRSNKNSSENNSNADSSDSRNSNNSNNMNDAPGGGNSNAPADEQQAVVLQLTLLEYAFDMAILKADKAALGRILADEFTNIDSNGKVKNKAQIIASLQGGNETRTILEPKLTSYTGDRATMIFIRTYKGQGYNERTRDTDTYVKRDGRWQVVSSQSTDVK